MFLFWCGFCFGFGIEFIQFFVYILLVFEVVCVVACIGRCFFMIGSWVVFVCFYVVCVCRSFWVWLYGCRLIECWILFKIEVWYYIVLFECMLYRYVEVVVYQVFIFKFDFLFGGVYVDVYLFGINIYENNIEGVGICWQQFFVS